MTTTTYNPRTYSTITVNGDYNASYRTELRNARKITLANLPAISSYADWIRREETAEEARRQLWYLYHDLKLDAAAVIGDALRKFPPAGAPDETQTAIIADYTRAILDAIAGDEEDDQ